MAAPEQPRTRTAIVAVALLGALALAVAAVAESGPPDATTCFPVTPAAPNGPATGVLNGKGVAGGCTRDLVHKYYQEQYQLHGGKLDRYVTGSDAAGLALGAYRTQDLPLYRYF